MTNVGAPLGWLATALLVLAALALGVRTTAILTTGGYRIDEEVSQPPPRRALRWWPPIGLALLTGYLAHHVGDLAGYAALPAYLLFAWLTVALVWIDLDVHRLPIGLVRPGGVGLLVLLALASVAEPSRRWLWALVAAAVLWTGYALLALLPGQGLGWGDVRLAALVGLALGWLGPAYVVVGVLAAHLLAGVVALGLLLVRRAGLRTGIAFGPALCGGALVAVGATSRIMAGLTGG
jgi:leader peptidase (prepilin peptidase)/N-methyltransferase